MAAMFQHTAARRRLVWRAGFDHRRQQCFNTQPPEGDCCRLKYPSAHTGVSTHSRPKATVLSWSRSLIPSTFQHTAARRRLGEKAFEEKYGTVSTHSRPKATGFNFNINFSIKRFQHTAARRRLYTLKVRPTTKRSFNTQPPEGD